LRHVLEIMDHAHVVIITASPPSTRCCESPVFGWHMGSLAATCYSEECGRKMNVSMYSSINAGSANWLGSYQDFEMWLSVIIPNLDAARYDTGSLHVATTLVDLKILLQDHKIQSLNFLKVLSSELISMIGLILGLHAGGRQLHRRAESSLASLRDIMPAASTPRTYVNWAPAVHTDVWQAAC